MQALKLQRKYPQVSQEEMMDLVNRFNAIDTDTPGRVTKTAVIDSLQKGGLASYDHVRETLKTVNVDSSGKVELEDYVELVTKIRTQASSAVLPSKGGKVSVAGSNANISHSYNDEERKAFTSHINSVLIGDPDIGARIPIPEGDDRKTQLFEECRDGLVLCKLINDSVPDTIDGRVLNVPRTKALNAFQITENNNIVITSAKAIGCSVVNIGPQDIADATEHLILGLIWQIIRRGLLSRITLNDAPELYVLLEDGESLDDLRKLPPDQLLLRWFNYHLKNARPNGAEWPRRVKNFSKDVADGQNYAVLLNKLAPNECSLAPLNARTDLERAAQVLDNADKIHCRKFLTDKTMVAGNPKLNLAFVANLFNTIPGLEAPKEAPPPPTDVEDFDAEGEREARVFTLWLNSLNVEPGVYNLFEDLRDGVIVVQAFDKIIPGCVNWKHVTKPKPLPTSPTQATFPTDDDEEGPVPHAGLSRFKAVENTNYVVDLAKANGMHIVGIQGSDIVDASKKLVLGLVWQLMRLNISKTLASLNPNGRPPTDLDILKWANETVKNSTSPNKPKPSTPAIRSFKDPSCGDALFFLDLLDALRPGIVNYELVYKPARSEEEKRQNAKLAISIARKMNALIFLVPEDIVEVRPKLILTFVGSLMSLRLK